jgi:coenzyme F420-reducing hydrogenase beta subunit
VQLCPKHCIKLNEHEDGFRYAEIDEAMCITCNQCRLFCPALNFFKGNKPMKAIAFQASSNKRKVQKESSSGGAFYILASKILDEGGVVFGCAWCETFKVKHIAVTTKEKLCQLQKSKYVQSDTGYTFVEAKEYLECGKSVLYSGTPCQIMGLKTFLKNEYKNLFTVDFVCHGVPSQQLFDDYLQFRAAHQKDKLLEFDFRVTDSHHPLYNGRELWSRNKKQYHKPLIWQNDSYYFAFMYGITCRDSCYQCRYACRNRVSDITLGDFWGIEKYDPLYEHSYGVSLVLFNTEKGMNLFKAREKDDVRTVNI